MVHSVLKKGERGAEPFIPGKIKVSIEEAVRGSGLPEEQAESAIREIHYEVISSLPIEREITTTEIRRLIVESLSSNRDDAVRMSVLIAWTDHERRFKAF